MGTMDINEQLYMEGSYDELFERNQAFIHKSFNRYKNIYIEFEEFYSLCSLAFTKALHGFEPTKAKFITYWGTAIHNEILNYLKSYKRREKYGLEFVSLDNDIKGIGDVSYKEILSDDKDDIEEFLGSITIDVVKDTMARLTRKQRNVFELLLEGHTQQEIADTLRVTRQAVGNSIKNSRIALSKELKKSGIYV